MAFIVRAFCTSDAVPALGQIFAWTNRHGFALALGPVSADVPLDTPDWTVAEIVYAPGRQPFLCDVKRDSGRLAFVFRHEVEDFLERVTALPPSPERERVLDHLRRTRYIIANEYLSDAEEDTYAAGGALLDYFVAHHGGLVHAEGEGFWLGETLLLPLP